MTVDEVLDFLPWAIFMKDAIFCLSATILPSNGPSLLTDVIFCLVTVAIFTSDWAVLLVLPWGFRQVSNFNFDHSLLKITYVNPV